MDILNSSHIEDLGLLVAGLDRKTLRKITKDAFIDNLYNIARAKGYDEKKMREIAKLAKQHFEKRCGYFKSSNLRNSVTRQGS